MKFAVEVGERTRTVEFVAGDLWPSSSASAVRQVTLTLDGRLLEVDVAAGERFWSLLIGGRSYEVAFSEEPGGVKVVHVDGEAVPVVVTAGVQFGSMGKRGRAASDGPDGAQRLVAPMPGRIVKLLVRVGDAVSARQGVAVIEAMKMENELSSPKAGTVREIRVAEGASVDAGAVLAVIE